MTKYDNKIIRERFETAIAEQLTQLGFSSSRKNGCTILAKEIEVDYEISLHSSFKMDGNNVCIDFIIIMDFVPLRKYLEASNESNATNVLHCYLSLLKGIREEWDFHLPVVTYSNAKELAKKIAQKIVFVAIPRLMEYCGTEQLKSLFSQDIEYMAPNDIVVSDSEVKLRALENMHIH